MGFGASKPDPDFPSITPILVPRTLRGYPSPKPPQAKKNDIINWERFATIDVISKRVTVDETTSYNELVTNLTQGLMSEVEKVRAIFTWLGSQRIYQSFYPGVEDATTPKGYMKLIKKELGSYTEFFALLCRAASIACVIVRGRCKTSKYEAGEYINPCMSSTWPVVFVDGNWQIVHPTWAFPDVRDLERTCFPGITEDIQQGNDTDNNNGGSAVDEFFFLPDPEEFRYFCWPEKSEWELTESPLTFDAFCKAPYFHSPYFTSGLKLVSNPKSTLTSHLGLCSIRFEHKPSKHVKLSYIMFVKQYYSDNKVNNARLECYVCKESGGNYVNLHVRFPGRGVYKIIIYGGMTHFLHPLTEFRLECNEDSYYCSPFPVRSSIGLGVGQRALGCGIHARSHLTGIVPLASGTEVFEFDHACPENIEAVLRHSYLSDTELRTCVTKVMSQQCVRFRVDIPDVNEEAEEFVLQIYTRVSSNSNALVNVLNYLLTSSPLTFGTDHQTESGEVSQTHTDYPDEHWVTVALDQPEEENNNNIKTSATKEDVNLNWNIQNAAFTEKVELLENSLSFAMKTRSREGLEMYFHELLCLGQDVSCFKQELATLLLLYEEAITEKRSANELEQLMHLIAQSNLSVMSDILKDSTTVATAKDFLSRQHRVQQYGAVIQTLSRHTVNSIAKCCHPNTITLDIMRASLMLLGEDDTSLQKWSNVQNLLTLAGSQSIVSRIARFNVDSLPTKVNKKVKNSLDRYKIDDVKAIGYGLAAFYLWALGVVMAT